MLFYIGNNYVGLKKRNIILLIKIVWPIIDFSIPWEKYIVRMISKTGIAKAMSGLSHFTCYCVKVDLYPKKSCSSKNLL